ncbi:MAG: septal ring lytic transglycosylase RlpA family protein [Ignavibacteria bacterium]|nr:MAG: septal ring lytic transglycosylase RlpA family protein [Ignavibacteria bacterium]
MVMILAVIGLVGFTIATNDKVSSETAILTEEFVPVQEQSIINTSIIRYIDRGTMRASWYGPRFHGRLTANGEIYDQNALTAAHKSLRFGTILRVTNTRTNKSVIVRINDRGPYIPGRQIDLSKAAAAELDVISSGVKKLKIEEIIIEGIDNPLVSLN